MLLIVTGCASTNTSDLIFDYTPTVKHASASTLTKPTSSSEEPKAKAASTLLGPAQAGLGYSVKDSVSNDGRFNVYSFKTDYGSYSVVGDGPARKHIQELVALRKLKNYSAPKEFLTGAGKAVISPIEGVVTTVTNPVKAARVTRANVERKVGSAGRGLAQAGKIITTFKRPEKTQPDRESENLVEKIVNRPEAKRRLARELNIDPYTHFIPLSRELDKVASYSAIGSFGVDRALGFVTGEVGTIISVVGTIDSLTREAIDMAPEEVAVFNRKRLNALNVPEAIIKAFMLSDKLTPSEKSLVVGSLNNLSGTPGLDALAASVAHSNTRQDAFATLQTLAFLLRQPLGGGRPTQARVVEGVPVLTITGHGQIAIVAADKLYWTPSNAARMTSLAQILRRAEKGSAKPELWISGNASALAKRQLQRQGWVVKTQQFPSI
ncbi:hypothetical protein [Nitratireductor sp. OM-1]|uniref:hypothetical protein n=1 Tax=Nitratireductor sp. OM-1 TaxID=1756988 RepID=UPI0013AF0F02|nr:hypothetical protein [Nitratireductor sp. OM-1]